MKARKWYFHQLFVNGRRAVRAGTPNEGYLRTDGPLPGFENPHKIRGKPEASMGFRFRKGDLKVWGNMVSGSTACFSTSTRCGCP